MEEQIVTLQKEIEEIKKRNKRVELDKAWEVSKTRTLFITLSTYVLIVIFMILTGKEYPFLNAAIGAVSYFISTESYGVLKKWWIQRNKDIDKY